MPSSKSFSGPPSNKATAATLAASMATLFWTIAAHTFWKDLSTADLTLYITASTTLLTAITGFIVPESAAFSEHAAKRLASQEASASAALIPAVAGSGNLDMQIRGIQELQNIIAAQMGIKPAPATPNSSAPAALPSS